jgi:hypothetical protein
MHSALSYWHIAIITEDYIMTAKIASKTATPVEPTTTVCEDIADFFGSCYDWTVETTEQAIDLLPDVEIKAGPGWNKS